MDSNEVDSIVGKHGKTQAEVKAGLTVDTAAIQRFDKELKAVKTTVASLRKEMESLATSSAKVSAASGSGPATAQNGTPQFTSTSLPVGSGGTSFDQMRARFGGAGGGGGSNFASSVPGGKAGVVAAGAAYGGGKILGAIDARIDSNRQYSISADRLSMDMQIRTGLSQNQVANQYRKPLTNYRLGNNGVNEMLAFQTRTGISAAQQAGGVENLRALTGYSIGTEDVLGIYQQNLNPAVANRQFMMMGGMSAYGAGGQPRDQFALMQSRAKMFQLNDPNIAQGALREGSISRHRMSMMGISASEQDMLINIGQAESTFRSKGGTGNFDLTNKDHRKLVGIEDNFAAQAEESDRLRVKREEDMYRRQADNYATLEESNQKLIKALNAVEDKLSGLIGARTSTRSLQNIAGAVVGGLGVGGFIGGKMFGSGDPPTGSTGSSGGVSLGGNSSAANDDKIMVPYGYSGNGPGGRKPLSEVKGSSSFKKLSSSMQDRLLRMMRDNPDVGIGQGWRDPEQQKKMFLERHVETTQGDHDRTWNGKYWKLVRGAPAAPPGSSMHEIGLAADLVGDLDWMNKNAAKYGLKHFAGVNGEPWHVQPSELPNSRSDYENGNASLADDFFGDAQESQGAAYASSSDGGAAFGYSGGGSTGMDFTGMSISGIVASYLGGGVAGDLGGGFVKATNSSSRTTLGSSSNTSTSSSAFDGPVSSGAMAAAQAAFAAGFRGDDLSTIVAIAGRESRWKSDAVNPNTSDRGMWQINWSNLSRSGYDDFRKKAGITGINDLLDVNKNASVAFKMYQDSVAAGKPWFPWRASDEGYNGVRGWDPNGDHMWHTGDFSSEASAAASAVQMSGDPADMSHRGNSVAAPARAGGSGSLAMNSTYQIDFSPNITIHAEGTSTSLRTMATDVGDMLREQVELVVQRSS